MLKILTAEFRNTGVNCYVAWIKNEPNTLFSFSSRRNHNAESMFREPALI
jgi:hypothetical protein